MSGGSNVSRKAKEKVKCIYCEIGGEQFDKYLKKHKYIALCKACFKEFKEIHDLAWSFAAKMEYAIEKNRKRANM